MPQVGTWLSFAVRAQLSPTLQRHQIPRASKAKASAQLPSSLRQQPFVQLALPPRVHPPEKWTIPATRASAFTLGLVTHDGNFEPTEDVPQPTSCYSLSIFTFHSCGGRRSCSTLRTCCDGLQIGCSEFPKPQFHKPWKTMSERCTVSC